MTQERRNEIDPQLTHNGIFQLAYSQEEVEILRAKMHWQREYGSQIEWLSDRDVTAQEPTLSPCHDALLLPNDSNINAPMLMKSLEFAAKRYCTVKEGVEVLDIRHQSHGTYTAITTTGSYSAKSIVVTAGAWANRLIQPFEIPCNVYPVKGQLLAIRPRNGHRLCHTVFSQHTYMVPKRDGTIVVGATEDRTAGFNRDLTTDAIAYLLSAVQRMAPELSDSVFERSWEESGPALRTIGRG